MTECHYLELNPTCEVMLKDDALRKQFVSILSGPCGAMYCHGKANLIPRCWISIVVSGIKW